MLDSQELKEVYNLIVLNTSIKYAPQLQYNSFDPALGPLVQQSRSGKRNEFEILLKTTVLHRDL